MSTSTSILLFTARNKRRRVSFYKVAISASIASAIFLHAGCSLLHSPSCCFKESCLCLK